MAGTSRPSSAAIAAAASALDDVVAAVQPQVHVGAAARGDHPERGPAPVVEADGGGAHVGHPVGRAGGGRAEPADPRPGAGGHRGHVGVVGVEDRDPVGRQRLDQLALGLGDRVERAELAGVGPADVEHRADPRRGDVAQLGDVADAAGRHLQHQVPGRLVGPQHGQRQAELVVEGADGGDGGAQPVDHLGGEVLGRGLARRPGDPDDGRGRQPAQHLPRERAEGDGHVGGDDHRHVVHVGDRPVGEHRDRARLGRDGGEVTAVHPLARQRGEQRARHRLARVDHDRPGHEGAGLAGGGRIGAGRSRSRCRRRSRRSRRRTARS